LGVPKGAFMHTDAQQLWLAWGQGRVTDAEAQARAEAHRSRNGAGPGRPSRPQNSPPTFSESRRGIRREKVFDYGRCVPLDRNAKVRVMMLARALARRTEPGRAYGAVTAKMLAVLGALLWGFHNAASGKCFPSYESIADRAACSRTTVYSAIRTLEQLGIMTWVNRIKRVREWVPGLFGKVSAWRWRVIRTSNAYAFTDPQASKFNFQTGTAAQATDKKEFASNVPRPAAFAAPMIVWAGRFSTAGT
jgi:hypothetical protein